MCKRLFSANYLRIFAWLTALVCVSDALFSLKPNDANASNGVKPFLFSGCQEKRLSQNSLRAEISFYTLKKARTLSPSFNSLEEASAIVKKDLFDRLGYWIAPESESLYKDCEDISCVYERLYEKTNALNSKRDGQVLALFYLKTGYAIGASNQYPIAPNQSGSSEVNSIQSPETEKLFSEEEVEALFAISHMIPERYLNFSKLKLIFKLHEKESIQGGCALFYAKDELPVSIFMAKECIPVSPKYAQQETIFSIFFHEFGHMIDTSPAYQGMPLFSRGDTYKSIAKQEKSIRSRDSDNELKEDFADAFSYHRSKPEYSYANQPLRDLWMQSTLFEGRSFTHSGLRNYYRQAILKSVAMNKSSVLESCGKNEACASKRIQSRLRSILSKLVFNEFEACQVLDQNFVMQTAKEAYAVVLNDQKNPDAGFSFLKSLFDEEKLPIELPAEIEAALSTLSSERNKGAP